LFEDVQKIPGSTYLRVVTPSPPAFQTQLWSLPPELDEKPLRSPSFSIWCLAIGTICLKQADDWKMENHSSGGQLPKLPSEPDAWSKVQADEGDE